VPSEGKSKGKWPDFDFILVSVGGVVPINPKTDKVARAVSVQQAFAHHLVYAPDRDFADMVKDATQALRWLREQGLLQRRDEVVRREEAKKDYGIIQQTRRGPIYRA
jgi:hypothetical protein